MKNTHLLYSVAALALTINLCTPSQSVAMDEKDNSSKTPSVPFSSASSKDETSAALVPQRNQQPKMTSTVQPTVAQLESSVELRITRHSSLLVFSLPDKTEVHVNNGNQIWVKAANQGYPSTPWERYASAHNFGFRVIVLPGDTDSLDLRIPKGSTPFPFFAGSEVAVNNTSTWVKEKDGPGYYTTSFDKFATKIGLPNAKATLVDVSSVSRQVTALSQSAPGALLSIDFTSSTSSSMEHSLQTPSSSLLEETPLLLLTAASTSGYTSFSSSSLSSTTSAAGLDTSSASASASISTLRSFTSVRGPYGAVSDPIFMYLDSESTSQISTSSTRPFLTNVANRAISSTSNSNFSQEFEYSTGTIDPGMPTSRPVYETRGKKLEAPIIQLNDLKTRIETINKKKNEIFEVQKDLSTGSQLCGMLSKQWLALDDQGKALRIRLEKLQAQNLLAANNDELVPSREALTVFMDDQLAEQRVQLAEKDVRLAEKDVRLAELEALLADKEAQLLAERDTQLAELEAQLAEKDVQRASLEAQRARRVAQLAALLNPQTAEMEVPLVESDPQIEAENMMSNFDTTNSSSCDSFVSTLSSTNASASETSTNRSFSSYTDAASTSISSESNSAEM